MRLAIMTVIALVALAGCSDENSQARGQFLSGCMQGGASKSICSCMLGKLEQKYSPAEMKAMSTPSGATSDQVIKDLFASALVCRQE